MARRSARFCSVVLLRSRGYRRPTAAGDSELEEQGAAAHEAADDLAIELRHRVAAQGRQPVRQDEATPAALADPVAGELLVDERLHPRIGLFGQLDDGRPTHLAVRPEGHRDADATVDRGVANEDERADHSSALVAADVEPIEILLRRPAGGLLDGGLLLGAQPDLAEEEALRAGEERDDRVAVAHEREWRGQVSRGGAGEGQRGDLRDAQGPQAGRSVW